MIDTGRLYLTRRLARRIWGHTTEARQKEEKQLDQRDSNVSALLVGGSHGCRSTCLGLLLSARGANKFPRWIRSRQPTHGLIGPFV